VEVAVAWKERVNRWLFEIPRLPTIPWTVSTEATLAKTFLERPVERKALLASLGGESYSFRGRWLAYGVLLNPEVTFSVPPSATHFQAIVGPPDTARDCVDFYTALQVSSDSTTPLKWEPIEFDRFHEGHVVSLRLSPGTTKVTLTALPTRPDGRCGKLVVADARFALPRRTLDTRHGPLPRPQALDARSVKPVLSPVFQFEADRHSDRTPIILGQQLYQRGLGLHANLVVSAPVPEGAQSLSFMLGGKGVNHQCTRTSFRLSVVSAEGLPLYHSPVFRSWSPPVPVVFDLQGAKELLFIGEQLQDYPDCDWIAIAEPYFL
jgi:hypothetical protein